MTTITYQDLFPAIKNLIVPNIEANCAMLESALAWAENGFHVLPIDPKLNMRVRLLELGGLTRVLVIQNRLNLGFAQEQITESQCTLENQEP